LPSADAGRAVEPVGVHELGADAVRVR
jgi:hypothetical protein